MTTLLRSALVFCISAALAGCAATRGSSPLPSSDRISLAPSSSRVVDGTGSTGGTLSFQITIPTNGKANSYVSPSTKGMLLSWTGAASGQRAFNLTPSDTRCVKTTKRVCTIAVSLKTGNYDASLNLYDKTPVSGQIPPTANLLSLASNVPFTITSGQTTQIAPTLLGVPASLSVGPMPITCVAIPPTPFPVTAFDADSHKIVGAYANIVELSDNDPSGATTIATSGPDGPPLDALVSSSDTATIMWNGNPIPGGQALITAQVGSVMAHAVFIPQCSPARHALGLHTL